MIKMKVLGGVLIFFGATGALACDCVKRMTDHDADLIFSGVPVASSRWLAVKDANSSRDREFVRYVFDSRDVVKGESRKQYFIDSRTNSCGVHFEIGKVYRVVVQYSSSRETEWVADQCADLLSVKKSAQGQ